MTSSPEAPLGHKLRMLEKRAILRCASFEQKSRRRPCSRDPTGTHKHARARAHRCAGKQNIPAGLRARTWAHHRQEEERRRRDAETRRDTTNTELQIAQRMRTSKCTSPPACSTCTTRTPPKHRRRLTGGATRPEEGILRHAPLLGKTPTSSLVCQGVWPAMAMERLALAMRAGTHSK